MIIYLRVIFISYILYKCLFVCAYKDTKYRKKSSAPQFCDKTVHLLYYHTYTMIDYIMTYTLRPLLTPDVAKTKINLALMWQKINLPLMWQLNKLIKNVDFTAK